LYYAEGVEYYLSAVEFPGRFFSIKRLGINPMPLSTACWRGYVASFAVYRGKLVLSSLETNNSDGAARPVAINGKMPEVVQLEFADSESEWREWHYRDINKVIRYTGRMLIMADSAYDYYSHILIYSSLNQNDFLELTFNKGDLIEVNDLSEVFLILREADDEETRNSQLARLPRWISKFYDHE